MKKTLVILCLMLFLFAPNVKASNESACEEALLSLLWKDINKAVDQHYNIDVTNGDKIPNNSGFKFPKNNG